MWLVKSLKDGYKMDQYLLRFLIVILVVSIPCIVLGYLITYKKRYNLISGWDASKFNDPDAYAAIIGKMAIGLGLFLFVVTLIWYQNIIGSRELTYIILVSAIAPVLIIVLAKKKYGK